MGHRNAKLVYKHARQGHLGTYHPEKGGNLQLDSFTMQVLMYMALSTYDMGDNHGDRLPRCYYGGWEPIAEDHGLLITPIAYGTTPVPDNQRQADRRRRANTARVRISKSWSLLQERDLIVRIRPAITGRNAVYALTIGTPEENQTVIALAKSRFTPEPEPWENASAI